ncbi:DUF4350 domain-containing protein [Thermococcus zilligii]|uniref:DUF4350 domain-containing protein n=1 Tax=Thermococcus zilligii TaxID=54076 RepID=UPI00029AAB04|nr:DUF4350 domain-containing protein [Thermococcus zilligii]
MRKTVKYALLVTGVFILFTMPLTVPYFKSSAQYSMFNPNWNGISKFAELLYREGKEPVPLLGPLDSYELSGGTLMIVGPDLDYTAGEIEAIKRFVEDGNTLFIADDFGTANEVLRGLNVPMGISEYPLRDFFYEIDDRFLITVKITDPVLGRDVDKVITNDPSAIIVTREGKVYTSGTAMINFHKRAYPILALMRYGKGRIIVLADPDILSNNLFDQNYPFLRNLVDYIPGPVYIDEGHHSDFNLYTQGTITIQRVLPKEGAQKILFLLGSLVVIYEFGVLRHLRKPLGVIVKKIIGGENSLEEIALKLAEENGWDKKEVLEMLRSLGD